MLKEGVGETARGILVDGIQRFGSLLWQGIVINPTRHPVIQTKSHQLPPQHIGGLQEDPRRRHLPSKHFLDFLEEIEIVRAAAIGKRRGERITVASPGTADPLQKARLIRRHRTQHHCRQIADIHAHLQCRRGGKQVFIPLLRVLRLEPNFQRLTLGTLKQTRVFRRNHSAQIPRTETLGQPTTRARLTRVGKA